MKHPLVLQTPRVAAATVCFFLVLLATPAFAVLGNVRINNPSGDPPDMGQFTPTLGTQIAFVLAGWMESTPTTLPVLNYGYSFNAGGSFTDGGGPPAPTGWTWRTDPVIAVNHKTGEFYYFGILVAAGPPRNRIGMIKGSFVFSPPSFTWGTPSFVSPEFLDNNITWLDVLAAASDSVTGNLYVSYVNHYTGPAHTEIYRSTDDGTSWSVPLSLSALADSSSLDAPRLALGPAGEVYAAWKVIGVKYNDARVRKSVDGGVSFAPEVTALETIENPISAPGPGSGRDFSLSVDGTSSPHRGRAYVTWTGSYFFYDDLPIGDGPARFEVEPNDTNATATPINVGDVIRGTTSSISPMDVDHFAVPLHAGDRFIIWPDSMVANQLYSVRMISPAGPDDQLFTHLGSPGHLPMTFTAPADGTYDLRFSAQRGGVTGGYRILTGLGHVDSEPALDQHDVLASHSDDGTTWSAPVRVNDEPIGYDGTLAEVLVAPDGLPYVMWNDYRDDPYGTRTHIYLTRSEDGGDTWGPDERVTNVISDWTPVSSTFGMGFHSAMASDGTNLHVGWADARVSNSDVYHGMAPTQFGVAQCPPADTSVVAGEDVTLPFQMINESFLFDESFVVDFTSDRGWPVPSTQTESVPINAVSFPVTASFQVPDTAALGVTTLTLHVHKGGGARTFDCPVHLHVSGGLVGVPDGPASFGLGPITPNPARGAAVIAYSLPRSGAVRLQIFMADGRLVRTLLAGERPRGPASAFWDGRDEGGRRARAGLYFCSLQEGGQRDVRRLAIMP